MQQPGDIMYVPHLWGHTVINVMDSIGLAVEFKPGYFQ